MAGFDEGGVYNFDIAAYDSNDAGNEFSHSASKVLLKKFIKEFSDGTYDYKYR